MDRIINAIIFCFNLRLNKSSKTSLDTVQNQALRLISGGMRTTPTAACEIHTNIEPLEFRRKRAALELYERSKRLEYNELSRNCWLGKEEIQLQIVFQLMSILLTYKYGIVYNDNIKLVEVAFFIWDFTFCFMN